MPEPEIVRAIKTANKSINSSLEGLKVDVAQSKNLLSKIVDFFSQLQKTIETGVRRIIQNQSMIMIISKTSELESFRDLLSEQQRVLEQKKGYLVKDLEKIKGRYLQLNQELSENAENTIQKLDGHVINLSQDYFLDTVGKSYRQHAKPLTISSERYFLDCAEERNHSLEGAAGSACQAIEQFLIVRSKFIEDTRNYFLEEDASPETQSTAVPFFVLKRSAEKEQKIIGPGTITYNDVSGTFAADPGVEEVVNNFNDSEKPEQISEKITYRPLSAQEKEDWLAMLDDLFEQGLLKDSENTSLHQELSDLIANMDIEIGERIDG